MQLRTQFHDKFSGKWSKNWQPKALKNKNFAYSLPIQILSKISPLLPTPPLQGRSKKKNPATEMAIFDQNFAKSLNFLRF